MSTILIDRKLLQKVLDAYFEADAESRAYLGMFQSSALKHPELANQYFDQQEQQKHKELSQTEGLRTALREKVRTEFDAAFLEELVPAFSSAQQFSRKRRTKSPPRH
jgi:hypothetical protein